MTSTGLCRNLVTNSDEMTPVCYRHFDPVGTLAVQVEVVGLSLGVYFQRGLLRVDPHSTCHPTPTIPSIRIWPIKQTRPCMCAVVCDGRHVKVKVVVEREEKQFVSGARRELRGEREDVEQKEKRERERREEKGIDRPLIAKAERKEPRKKK
ncbi:hypothetical protein BJ508DRAFT_414397 [Ascobolus immersus RN42]|uniref:Uncharacterized protein n=1 Tax=Ascobolus immersus RN42 TaxID=1160509 RepID=A0A3N4I749_ASCIM|nr:hypothetical protein BJ508DRAFT_414397 [Ascobolus immersus RN42]